MPLNILQQSPHDLAPLPEAPAKPTQARWVPSRYTVRATTDDGRLILWNTLNGAMSIFREGRGERRTYLMPFSSR